MNVFSKEEVCINSKKYSSEALFFLHPEQIRIPNTPKRTKTSENTRIRIAESIRKYGVLHPFSVRPWQDANGFSCYQLVKEEERFRAACLAGIERIPCRLITTDDRKEYALIAEMREKKLHFLDEAALFYRLIHEFSMKQAEIASQFGLSQSSVANKLRLLQLSEPEKGDIRRAGLGERHARSLLRIDDPQARRKALDTIILNRLSVADSESLVDRICQKEAQEPVREPDISTDFIHFSDISAPNSTQKTNISANNSEKSGATSAIEDTSLPRRISTEVPKPRGILPHKFILHDLQPLYNSIERTLSIFRKTGMDAEFAREECADAVKIFITIPKSTQNHK